MNPGLCEVRACLQQLMELEQRKQEVILAQGHAQLQAIAEAESSVLTQLHQAVDALGHPPSEAVLPLESAVAEIRRLSAINGALLQEQLAGVGVCLELLAQMSSPTYALGEGRCKAAQLTPTVFDVRA